MGILLDAVHMKVKAVVHICLKPEARPFFDETNDLLMAPPDGLGGAQPTFSIEGVDVLVLELLAA